ncbi:MAG TPA: response regulator [Candidatus Brocadiia bacterium]|nr:response regulator [Candidatus Brocadiia bacterium]
MKILVVDDDDIGAEMLSMALTQAGHETVTVHDAESGLKALEDESIRVVISDWVMPGMDGLELCRRIRSGGFGRYVYVIMLTAQDKPEHVVEGLSAGADDFVRKPFNTAELLVRVKSGERVVSLETRHVAIFAMAKLAESRDPETGQHLERMRNYSRILAAHLTRQDGMRGKLGADFVENVYLTSPLHDIGKVGIPDYVLLKPGRLTDEEFDLMKHHTSVGADTLAAAARQYPGVEYLRIAEGIARGHHERFNGKGYPNGVKGEEIPLCARIVALADVYDALVSKRVYKAAMPHDVAKNIILKERGEQFDPMVVDAFLAHEAEFVECREKFAEVAAGE